MSGISDGPGGIPKIGDDTAVPPPERINLGNGRAGQAYRDQIAGYTALVLVDDGGSRLAVTAGGEVTGDAPAAGDYTLMLEGQREGRTVTIALRISIIADPRDLWKSIPSDQSAPFAKPDAFFGSVQGAGFLVAGSVRGRSHAQEGKYREDHVRIHADPQTGWHYLVVADGAGSAPLSRLGSKIACDTVMGELPGLLAQFVDPLLEDAVAAYDEAPQAWAQAMRTRVIAPALPQAALAAAHAIEAEAVAQGRGVADFATTLLIAVSRKIGARWFTASFCVGDGGVVLYDAAGAQVQVMCRPDSGEFAGQTRFLTRAETEDEQNVMGRIFVDLRPGFTVLVAMTDGITDPKFPTDAVLARAQAWEDFWTRDLTPQVDLRPDNPDLEQQMLDWLGFWSRGNHDDRTIALMLP